jgi:ABC-type multidrug transport system ATPase subunit
MISNIVEENGNIDLKTTSFQLESQPSPFHIESNQSIINVEEEQSPMIRDMNDKEWDIMWKSVSKFVVVKKVSKAILYNCCGWVKGGEMLALVGSSGSGKTTLMNILAGRYTSGIVYVNGYKYSSDMRRKISFILQEDCFINSSSYTLRDHLSFICALKSCYKMKAYERYSLIDDLTNRLAINNLLEVPLECLSGGERKRASICAGLLGNGKILLIDGNKNYL